MTIIDERLNQPIHLKSGKHSPTSGDMCLLEAAAWIAGEPWSDRPECVDPVLAAFGRSWNDGLPDDDRDRILLPFLPQLIGTRTTASVQDRRAFMAADWAVRVFTPTWLDLANLTDHAEALRSLPMLDSAESCRSSMVAVRAAGAAARAAAGDAAWDAAWAAAGAAARDAARDALAPTVSALQASAADLYTAMINIERTPQ